MAASREVEQWDNFSGGLNLTTQTQSLRPSESPDALNMDFGLRGGFMLRGGFQTQATDALLEDAKIMGVANLATSSVLIQSSAGDLLEWDGTTLSDTGFNVTDTTDRVRMACYNDKAYLANGRSGGSVIVQSWDGTSKVTLGNAWNNDYTTPTTGNMPKARHVALHNGFLWVAHTNEGGTDYPARVRFSHEQNVESWAEADYFEVGAPGVDDPITTLLAFNDSLLIFKKSSVWAVYGYDRDTFVLERISNASGICTCGAMTTNAGVAYWYSTDGQLMAWNGQSITSLSKSIDWWSEEGKIQHGGAHRLMWSDGRLWLSLEAGQFEDVDRWLFIWDPAAKAFTRYDREVSELVHWSKLGEDGDPLFLEVGSTHLFRYDRSYEYDIVGTTDVQIYGYYRTAWMTAGETATRKRWKRPRVTAAANAAATVQVDVYMDFNDTLPTRSGTFEILVPSDATLWGDDWGSDWYVKADDYYRFARLSSAGTGYSVSFKFSSTNNVGRWWCDSIAVPFRRKKVK
jgi:hypothetical protein